MSKILDDLTTEFPSKDIWIIGGANIYDQCWDLVEEVYWTRFWSDYMCDTFVNGDRFVHQFGKIEVVDTSTGSDDVHVTFFKLARDIKQVPYANRALESMICALAAVIKSNPEYYKLSKDAFVFEVMKASGGKCNPSQIADWRYKLLKDLGLDV